MDIQNLNIGITLFQSKEQLDKFLALAGVKPTSREAIYKNYEGVIWSKTTDNQYALYLSVLNALHFN